MVFCEKLQDELGDDGPSALEPATDALLALVGNEREAVSRAAVVLVAWLRPPAEKAMPVLIRAIQAGEGSRYKPSDQWVRIASLGAFPRASAESVPLLLEILERRHEYGVVAALGLIGAPAAEAIPALRSARERFEFQFKSDKKQWQHNVDDSIRRIEAAVAREQDPSEPTYVEDLIRRMSGEADEPWAGSSTRSASGRARAEARRLTELSRLPEIERPLQTKLRAAAFRDVVYVAARLAENAESPEALEVLRTLFDRPRLRKGDCQALALEAYLIGADGRRRVAEWLEEEKLRAIDWEVQHLYKKDPQPELFVQILNGILNASAIHRNIAMMNLKDQPFPEGTLPLCALLDNEEMGYRKDDDYMTRVWVLEALAKCADERAVPTLRRELLKFRRETRASCLPILERLAPPEAYEDVLETMKKLPREIRRHGHGPEGFLPYVAHGFGYFAAAGFASREEVIRLLDEYRVAPVWNALQPEERRYLEVQFGVSGPVEQDQR